MSYLCQKCKENWGVNNFVSEIHLNRVENYPSLENSVHVIQHDLKGFIAKNTDGESVEANKLSHTL